MSRFKYSFPDSIEPGGALTVIIDGNTFPTAGPIDDAGAHIGEHAPTPPTGYESDLSQMLLGKITHYKIIDGVLTNMTTNQPVVDAVETTEIPHEFENRDALIQWLFEHGEFHSAIYLDGTKIENQGSFGTEPGAHFGTVAVPGKADKVVLESWNTPPVATVVTVPTHSEGVEMTVDFPAIQDQLKLNGNGQIKLHLHMPATAQEHPSNIGAIDVVELLGGVTTIDFTAKVDGKEVYGDHDGNNNPSLNFTVGVPTTKSEGNLRDFAPGTVLDVDLIGGTGIRVDLKNPNRY